jgi:predicted alpha/beta-hydrolase family hydrolase
MWIFIGDPKVLTESSESDASERNWFPSEGCPIIQGNGESHSIPSMSMEKLVEQCVTQPGFAVARLELPIESKRNQCFAFR